LENLLQIKVGKRIQQIRIEKNISQQDLAARCNFEKSNMSRLEAGRANATLSTLEIVSKALEVDVVELFKFENNSGKE
jgi:transcriptional regulator with XRE-family HTH domain